MRKATSWYIFMGFWNTNRTYRVEVLAWGEQISVLFFVFLFKLNDGYSNEVQSGKLSGFFVRVGSGRVILIYILVLVIIR